MSFSLVVNGEGREVAETCSRTACSACNDREGPQMSGHHNPLLSRQPCQIDPQPCRTDPSSPIGTLRLLCQTKAEEVLIPIYQAEEIICSLPDLEFSRSEFGLIPLLVGVIHAERLVVVAQPHAGPRRRQRIEDYFLLELIKFQIISKMCLKSPGTDVDAAGFERCPRTFETHFSSTSYCNPVLCLLLLTNYQPRPAGGRFDLIDSKLGPGSTNR